MAQQQDPNADPAARGNVGQAGISAGSQDTYKSPGFRSSTVSTTGNVPATPATPGTPATPAAPTSGVWGKWTGSYTPGIQAAIGSGGSGQPGAPNKPGIGSGAILGQMGIGGNMLSDVLGLNNNSALQDIGGALYQGLPVTDAMWSRGGYGPGGATLGAQPSTGLSGATVGPTVGALLGPSAGAAFGSAIGAQPSTVPAGATLSTGAQVTPLASRYANPALFGGAAAL